MCLEVTPDLSTAKSINLLPATFKISFNKYFNNIPTQLSLCPVHTEHPNLVLSAKGTWWWPKPKHTESLTGLTLYRLPLALHVFDNTCLFHFPEASKLQKYLKVILYLTVFSILLFNALCIDLSFSTYTVTFLEIISTSVWIIMMVPCHQTAVALSPQR